MRFQSDMFTSCILGCIQASASRKGIKLAYVIYRLGKNIAIILNTLTCKSARKALFKYFFQRKKLIKEKKISKSKTNIIYRFHSLNYKHYMNKNLKGPMINSLFFAE